MSLGEGRLGAGVGIRGRNSVTEMKHVGGEADVCHGTSKIHASSARIVPSCMVVGLQRGGRRIDTPNAQKTGLRPFMEKKKIQKKKIHASSIFLPSAINARASHS